jgi:hypothetical protein
MYSYVFEKNIVEHSFVMKTVMSDWFLGYGRMMEDLILNFKTKGQRL